MTESKSFKKIDFKLEPLSPNHIYIGHDHTILIAKNEKVYAWGCYVRESEEKALHKPTHVPFFDNFKVHLL